MNVVIADTSCLIVLDRIGQLLLLQRLFGEVTVTEAVRDEYGNELPSWVHICQPTPSELLDELMCRLDRGEATSIALAFFTPNSLIIMDELKGRRTCETLELNTVGTLGVLLMARQQGLLPNMGEVVDGLRIAGFRLSPRLAEILLQS
jgi:predicted nucleic acid-binding protein